jgi:hypothetical protein
MSEMSLDAMTRKMLLDDLILKEASQPIPVINAPQREMLSVATRLKRRISEFVKVRDKMHNEKRLLKTTMNRAGVKRSSVNGPTYRTGDSVSSDGHRGFKAAAAAVLAAQRVSARKSTVQKVHSSNRHISLPSQGPRKSFRAAGIAVIAQSTLNSLPLPQQQAHRKSIKQKALSKTATAPS